MNTTLHCHDGLRNADHALWLQPGLTSRQCDLAGYRTGQFVPNSN